MMECLDDREIDTFQNLILKTKIFAILMTPKPKHILTNIRRMKLKLH